MTWFFVALIGPVLYAVANHADKYLISKYMDEGEVGSIIIFSSLFSVVTLPIIGFLHPDLFNVTLFRGLVLAANGTLAIFSLLLYFMALHVDEATYVVPFYQTIPIFAFVLGYFVLGETISAAQAWASLLILAGALVLSVESNAGRLRFKKRVVGLMLGASLLLAIEGVVFKLIAVEEGFWVSTFWGMVGKVILGLGFWLFVKPYRTEFNSMIRRNSAPVFGLIALSETLFLVAEITTQYAYMLAPVALVLLVNSFQPLFVFLLGVLLTVLLPKIAQEKLTKHALIQKIAGILIIGLGTYFLP